MEKEAKKRFRNKKLREYLFIYGLLAYPLLNFIVFYVIKNANSVLMAFQNTDTKRTFRRGLDSIISVA